MYLGLNGLRRWDFSEGPEALHATSMNQTPLVGELFEMSRFRANWCS